MKKKYVTFIFYFLKGSASNINQLGLKGSRPQIFQMGNKMKGLVKPWDKAMKCNG